jgi:hypothetical protein
VWARLTSPVATADQQHRRMLRRELAPRLTPGELDGLHEQLGVELPEEYQQFLLHVGRGGPGPFHGIHPVEHVDGTWQWFGDEDWDPNDLGTLAEPFPLRASDWRLAEELEAEHPDHLDLPSHHAYDAALEEWYDRREETVFNPRRTHGALYICHEGRGDLIWLIVTGPERGHVWLDHRGDGRGMAPAWLPHHRRVGFGQWYLHWLGAVEAAGHPAGDQQQPEGAEEHHHHD